MTVNDIDDGHLIADDDAIVAMPALNQTAVILNVSIVCVWHIVHLMVNYSIQCHHVDSVHALHVIPVERRKKSKLQKKNRKSINWKIDEKLNFVFIF